jgi:hypothetical protein
MGATTRLAMAAAGIDSVLSGHIWLLCAMIVAPAVLICLTSIVMVLAVERRRRVEAIKALAPVVATLNKLGAKPPRRSR